MNSLKLKSKSWSNLTQHKASIHRNKTRLRTRCTDRPLMGVCAVWQTSAYSQSERRIVPRVRGNTWRCHVIGLYRVKRKRLGAISLRSSSVVCPWKCSVNSGGKLARNNIPPSARWKRPSTRLTKGNVRIILIRLRKCDGFLQCPWRTNY